jgi:hypothetical protein
LDKYFSLHNNQVITITGYYKVRFISIYKQKIF